MAALCSCYVVPLVYYEVLLPMSASACCCICVDQHRASSTGNPVSCEFLAQWACVVVVHNSFSELLM
ncbi:hypothetical protein P3T76_011131 [Phytophthora citrophthora]|uniref:Uncharacterized protein n=1 Tax=Phytophthora citrophthora TaxID=4793 RepID=A0AAD9G9Z6_9STRA|nr:hypothetical protein P3T76_011119 [Phytophthora citrophthora]KAK1934512.1 hypothetical protein P3T76_011121 [Phytophthora citrophthora]KAK1934514.1 hypothetical protein P3T76_011123 [Phytophthora citrophthora]KAK1934516.1 hypothetical protein P3T76_011125 [Phytophthora citrophthora]KAK1934518.1 hypothetical protein P3T76_011127 [Phytophthora citrophthora]